LRTFLAVTLLLAAVVAGAWYINHDVTNQASVSQPNSSSTGAGTGESGSASKTSPGVNAPEIPEKTPESEPKQQP
jgi:hypothetical protein